MTKVRQPETFQDAMMQVVAELGADRCGALLRCTPRQVRKWTDPDSNEYPRADDMVTLDLAYIHGCGRTPPLLRTYLRQMRAGLDKPIPVGDLVTEALDVPAAAGRFAETLRRVRDASSPGGATLTLAEKRDLRRAVSEIQRQCDDVLRVLK